MIETTDDLAGQFNVRQLILTNRNGISLVKHNIRRLKDRISEKTVCLQVTLLDLA